MLAWWQFVSAQEAAPKAKQAALRALELDPSLPEAHASLGLEKADCEWDWGGAEKELKEALRANPCYETAYRWYGTVLIPMERYDEALAAAKRGQELDPTAILDAANVGLVLYHARRYDEALDQLRKTVEMDVNYFPTRQWLALAYLAKHMPEQALREAQKAAVLSNNSTYSMTVLASSHAAVGNIKDAKNIVQNLQAVSKSRYISPFELAAALATVNEKEPAFELLAKA